MAVQMGKGLGSIDPRLFIYLFTNFAMSLLAVGASCSRLKQVWQKQN
jgi:hypothetical protein